MGEDVAHQAPPWVGSRSPDGWDQIPLWAVGWVLHQPPWSFGFDSKREEPGKTGRHPVLKYRVPHGSHPPREQLCNRYCSNKHTQDSLFPCIWLTPSRLWCQCTGSACAGVQSDLMDAESWGRSVSPAMHGSAGLLPMGRPGTL